MPRKGEPQLPVLTAQLGLGFTLATPADFPAASELTKPGAPSLRLAVPFALGAVGARPRQYGDPVVAILFGRASGRCSAPTCRRELVLPAVGSDPAAVVGERAHIFAFSTSGPRPNSSLSAAERNGYPNLILLCGYCHTIVDKQPDSHPVALLEQWKAQHEAWAETRLRESGADIEASTLEVACAALLDADTVPDASLALTPVPDKMAKNQLTSRTERWLLVGSLQARQIGDYLDGVSQYDPKMPARLRRGFVRQYEALVNAGLRGDDLFAALMSWSAGKSTNFDRQSAGLAVLVYLFSVCDVFER